MSRCKRFDFDYEIVRKSGQKNLYLRIRSDGSVLVSAPDGMEMTAIEAFIDEKGAWVRRKLAERETYAKGDPSVWQEDTYAWFLGQKCPIRRMPALRNAVRYDRGSLLFYCRQESALKEALHRFYSQEATRFIPSKVAYWEKRMGLHAKKITFRHYKSRWGCCRSDGTIVFNTLLMRYEPELIDYVVVHELAHLRHPHHGREFWDMVVRYIPRAKALRKRLV